MCIHYEYAYELLRHSACNSQILEYLGGLKYKVNYDG